MPETLTAESLDVRVRSDFPFLAREVDGKPIIYFDNAATTQKPKAVIEAVSGLYSSGIANVHRAVNFLGDEVTDAFEAARETVARFVGAQSREIIFVQNTTHAVNLACSGVSQGNKIRVLASAVEHHSNLLPWMEAGDLELIPCSPTGQLDRGVLAEKLATKPDLLSIGRASNFLGTLHPIREIVAEAHKHGVPVLIDAAQSMAHERHDVNELGCDFLAFSGHKVYGPGGAGALYVHPDRLENLKPLLVGGGIVTEVHADGFKLNDVPHRFEAGTPNIEGAVGLAAALEYIDEVGYETIEAHERELTQYAKQRLAELEPVTTYGPGPDEPSAPLVAFTLKVLEPGGVARTLANRANIIVRSGFHCAQPGHESLGMGPTVRASFGMYNSKAEIDQFVDVLKAMSSFI